MVLILGKKIFKSTHSFFIIRIFHEVFKNPFLHASSKSSLDEAWNAEGTRLQELGVGVFTDSSLQISKPKQSLQMIHFPTSRPYFLI